jgi:GNAT superfamily N-acetyltransferase
MRTRRAEVVDAERLAAFAAHTFTDTFGEANRPEDLEQFVRETYGVAQQTRELEDPGIVTILIEDDARLAAFAQVRRGERPACVDRSDAVELWRFYVHREWHGRGVGTVLMEEVLRAARELEGGALWLSVW